MWSGHWSVNALPLPASSWFYSLILLWSAFYFFKKMFLHCCWYKKFLMKMPKVSELLLVALSFSVNYQHEISLMLNYSLFRKEIKSCQKILFQAKYWRFFELKMRWYLPSSVFRGLYFNYVIKTKLFWRVPLKKKTLIGEPTLIKTS